MTRDDLKRACSEFEEAGLVGLVRLIEFYVIKAKQRERITLVLDLDPAGAVVPRLSAETRRQVEVIIAELASGKRPVLEGICVLGKIIASESTIAAMDFSVMCGNIACSNAYELKTVGRA